MDFDFSFAASPVASQSLALRTVYSVQADPSYDVDKSGEEGCGIIALRTFHGIGGIRFEGGEEQTLLPDTLLVFRYADVRRYRCIGELWDFRWFEFDAEGMAGLPTNTLLSVAFSEQESADSRRALELLKIGTPESLAAASALMAYLLQDWRCRAATTTRHRNPSRKAVEDLIVLLRLEDGLALSIPEMAGSVGLCERRFRQVFESVAGRPPKRYLDELRLQRAADLLRNTPFSIGTISDRLGYCHPFHFSRAFCKVHGISPSLYRKLSTLPQDP